MSNRHGVCLCGMRARSQQPQRWPAPRQARAHGKRAWDGGRQLQPPQMCRTHGLGSGTKQGCMGWCIGYAYGAGGRGKSLRAAEQAQASSPAARQPPLLLRLWRRRASAARRQPSCAERRACVQSSDTATVMCRGCCWLDAGCTAHLPGAAAAAGWRQERRSVIAQPCHVIKVADR